MTIPLPPAPKPRTSAPSARWLGLGSLLSLAAAVVWLLWASVGPVAQPPNSPRLVTALESGVVAAMDSPLFRYSPGWRTSALGADPSEPANPWDEPAGEVAFSYTGKALALQLAVGDYWGYLFVTVDGAPANRLAVIPGNQDSRGEEAGYKPFLAPERQSADGAALVWLPVHQADDDGPHAVRLEVWRSWGQFPLRGVAIDALPVPRPRWPAGLLGLLGLAAIIFGFQNRTRIQRIGRMAADDSPGISFPVVRLFRPTRVLFQSSGVTLWLLRLWPGALLLVGGGVALESWLLTDVGLGLLALAGLRRAEVWVAALLFGLPFYLHPLPILPGRSLNLIEIGVWGGLLLVGLGRLGTGNGEAGNGAKPNTHYALRTTHYVFLLLLWSLLSALAAEYTPLALREWRTLFLAAGGFALLLAGVFAQTDDPARTRRLLFSVWLAGGTAVALIALWQFAFDQMLIQAEGVLRVRGLYGSPNNLALYLERTVAVGVGYWVLRIAYVANPRAHFVRNTQYVILLLPQLAALVLTFSKGALFLGLPALLLVLGVGGALLMKRQGRSLAWLWWLVGIGGVIGAGLLPFLGTERFRLLWEFGPGSTGGLRLQLWRSAWAMALDHPWLGVGPDNFLYAYRSGYILPGAWQDPSLNHPHNFVLDWWTRLGLPGLLLAALWVGGAARRLWRQTVAGQENGALALGCLAAIAGALAHGLIDASFALPDLLIVWVFLLYPFWENQQ